MDAFREGSLRKQPRSSPLNAALVATSGRRASNVLYLYETQRLYRLKFELVLISQSGRATSLAQAVTIRQPSRKGKAPQEFWRLPVFGKVRIKMQQKNAAAVNE